ncbi:MAG TPA: hypothetical protein VLN61_06460 [Pseudolabrys sp.]|nr:hypothetical protein [Pseudolabrys sp.]
MNTHATVPGRIAAAVTQNRIAPAEWHARIDLAAVYRLLAHYGWNDVIYNHSSMWVPGEPRNTKSRNPRPVCGAAAGL